jgi:diguanylate cyclase (GGDEF)-like protein
MSWRLDSAGIAPRRPGAWASALLGAALLALLAGFSARAQAEDLAGASTAEQAARRIAAGGREAATLLASLGAAQGAAADAYERSLRSSLERLAGGVMDHGDPILASELAGALAHAGARGRGGRAAAAALERLAARADALAEVGAAEGRGEASERARRLGQFAAAADAAGAVLVALGLVACLIAVASDRRLRRRLEELLPPETEGEGLASRVARLRGRERLALERRDRELLRKLTLAEAYEQLERAQAELYGLLGERESQVEQLRTASLRDELTGAFKYLYMVHRIRELFRELLDHGRPFCILSLDLDNFKDINDQFGHAAGDDALRSFAGLLQACCRERDVVVRKSGDEFFILVPGAPAADAVALGERLVRMLKAHEVASHDAFGRCHRFRLAASIGVLDVSQVDVAALRGIADPDMAVREVLSYVDAALSRAKYSGKGCVRAYETGLRIRAIGADEASPDIERLYRYRNLYPGLPPERKREFDNLASRLSEMLFPRPKSATAVATDPAPGGGTSHAEAQSHTDLC